MRWSGPRPRGSRPVSRVGSRNATLTDTVALPSAREQRCLPRSIDVLLGDGISADARRRREQGIGMNELMETLTIGVADDEPLIRQSICGALRDGLSTAYGAASLAFVEFERAADVVDCLLDNPERLDLLVLDVSFDATGGGETGVDILPDLRNLRVDLPVFLLTGSATDGQILDAAEFGVDDYHAKPLREAEFVRQVYLLLKRSAPERNRQREMWKVFEDASRARSAPAGDISRSHGEVLEHLFPGLRFHARAVTELFQIERGREVLRCLARLDQNENPTGGERRQPYAGVEGVLEIRVNRAVRLFARRDESGWVVLAFTAQHEHTSRTFATTLAGRSAEMSA